MYKKTTDRQILLSEFNCPMGLTLDPNNRWVKKAALIPWNKIEECYASLFPGKNGVVAKPVRMALGALIIQKTLNCSDREVIEQIKENPYLQFFIGLTEYTNSAPFVPSLLVEFRKRLNSSILADINEMIISASKPDDPQPPSPPTSPSSSRSDSQSDSERVESVEDDDSGANRTESPSQSSSRDEENKGTLILDATCAPQKIAYPQDVRLLNAAREKAEHLIRKLSKELGENTPRMYSRKAHQDWLSYARSRKHTRKKLREAKRKQLNYIRRNLRYIGELLQTALKAQIEQTAEAVQPETLLCEKQRRLLETIRTVYAQQLEMYRENKRKVADRIVSLDQPYIRPIVRGKAKAPVEFGVKFDLSVADGVCRVEHMSFDAYNESSVLVQAVERYKEREGHYPSRVLADKIYRTRANLQYCKEHDIRLSGPALGRPKKDAERDRKQEYQDNTDRIEVERQFSVCKGSFGLGLITTRLAETTFSSILLSIIAMNVDKIAKAILSAHFGEILFGEVIWVPQWEIKGLFDDFSKLAA